MIFFSQTPGERPVSSATDGDVRESSLNEFLTFINYNEYFVYLLSMSRFAAQSEIKIQSFGIVRMHLTEPLFSAGDLRATKIEERERREIDV